MWQQIRRKSQIPPKRKWRVWCILAGRGFGKTRTGAETLQEFMTNGKYKKAAIIGASILEVMNIMLYGNSGLMTINPKLKYISKNHTVVWPNNSIGICFGGEYFDKIRGYEFDIVWIDEFAKIKNANLLWEQIQFSLRIGNNNKIIITTTPRNIQILKDIISLPDTYLTNGSSYENKKNLSKDFYKAIKQYENTTIGDQEIYGKITNDHVLWNKSHIIYDNSKIIKYVIGVDPGFQGKSETGIILAGMSIDNNYYILEDYSGYYKPDEWTSLIAKIANEYKAEIILEVNQGGNFLSNILTRDIKNIKIHEVRATQSKYERAMPIFLLYNKKRVYHKKLFPLLEEQMLYFTHKKDRLDALVWSVYGLYKKKTLTTTLLF
ncbi:hypothetical protein AB836_01815 [Rickettsiales bacterium (ex Bugula neritina AB1)]|nr:hypothetical protein AB836_01815 [Rickettsiales bacterium (ex Bugula neritina AB1)]